MYYLPLNSSPRPTGYQQRVKEANIKRIFDLIRSGKCSSRADLVRAMKLSATSVSVLVEELEARGLISETGPQQTYQPGRRPITLRANGDARQIVVFILHREGVRCDLLNADCALVEQTFVPFDSGALEPGSDAGDLYAGLFTDILENRLERYDPGRAEVVGLAFPGIFLEYEQALLMRSTMGIRISLESVQRFQQRTQLPVLMSTAPRCIAYAEKKLLDSMSADDPETRHLLYMHIGRWIGGAIISDGDLYTGPFNVAGEFGHITIDHRGRPCHCGSIGCLERYVSEGAILDDARKACREAGLPEPGSFRELAGALASEPPVAAVLDAAAEALASGIHSLMCATGMHDVLLGGAVSALGETFLQSVCRGVLNRNRLIRRFSVRYACAGENAESAGLARYFLDKHFTVTD